MPDQRYAICIGSFYEDLAERLIVGARVEFSRSGVRESDIEVFEVPGAFELPLAAHYCATSGRFAGVACLGAVVRGETDHYDFVCGEAAPSMAAHIAPDLFDSKFDQAAVVTNLRTRKSKIKSAILDQQI